MCLVGVEDRCEVAEICLVVVAAQGTVFSGIIGFCWRTGLPPPPPLPLCLSPQKHSSQIDFLQLVKTSRMSSLWIGTLAQLLIRAALSSQWPLLKEGEPLVKQNPTLSYTNGAR